MCMFLFSTVSVSAASSDEKVVLRICNWEEYIDEGDWDEEEVIDLESGDILGENSLLDDFEEWYKENYGVEVEVQYSTFGTNEDLYNMLTIGDVYDLVCPSEYMIMKLMAEGRLEALSEEFFDESVENNYYIRGVSPFIRDMFESNSINGEAWANYAAGYMWGVTGIVYNPELVDEEDVKTYNIITNPKYYRQITLKDSVRESYFPAMAAIKAEKLQSEEFLSSPDYHDNLMKEMNDVSPETIDQIEDYLKKARANIYSFETDSGKADMITGKVVANYQWSGDAVYIMDQADEDDYPLMFSVPEECTNIYFDGWVMLKAGVDQDPAKKQACEAFMNFMSRPDNVIRNMYYIGYTSVISGGEDERIFEYLDWNFSAEEESEETVEYDVSYFFADDKDEKYTIMTDPIQLKRQLFAQYPTEDVINRTSIMTYFDDDTNSIINQMWINVRCFSIKDVPIWAWILIVLGIVYFIALLHKSNKIIK
ncbi:MAG: extracellular solute-binding protein [Lachnospiraceae bacterium]|nr:extracellular solute-binding protein [Lachnospiraceae bacterium]